ncbi:MAG TPA: response regulator, partial [bacterium]|nr:response regulator [bacterium]
GIDGWRFCRLLRSAEYRAFNKVPILVVSATYSGEEASRISDDIGANAFMSAPVDGAHFVEQVRSLLGGRRAEELLRLLIVEDSKTQGNLLKKFMQSHGYTADIVQTASDAERAFFDQRYNVAVIDFHLPDRNGDQLLTAFREIQPECVFIMMTTDPSPELALAWMRQGASAYIRKPFEPEYLLELLTKARRERALLRVEDLLEERTRELRASEAALREAEEIAQMGRWELDHHTGRLEWSDTIFSIFEIDKEHFGASYEAFLETIHPDDRDRVDLAYRESLQHRKPYDVVHRLLMSDGRIKWLSERCSTDFDSEGKPIRSVGVVQDVSAVKKSEQMLRERGDRLHRYARLLSDLIERGGFFTGSFKDAVKAATEAASSILKTERVSVWIYNSDCSEIHCADLYQSSLKKHSEGENLKASDFPNYTEAHKIGQVIAAEDVFSDPRTSSIPRAYFEDNRIKSLLDAPVWVQGKLAGLLSFEHTETVRTWLPEEEQLALTLASFVSLCLETQERKKAEQALRISEKNLSSIFNVIKESVFLLDCEGIVLAANQTFAERLAVTVADCVGRLVYSLIPSDIAEKRRAVVQRVLRTKEPIIFEDERRGL